MTRSVSLQDTLYIPALSRANRRCVSDELHPKVLYEWDVDAPECTSREELHEIDVSASATSSSVDQKDQYILEIYWDWGKVYWEWDVQHQITLIRFCWRDVSVKRC